MKFYGGFATIALLFILQVAGQDADDVVPQDEIQTMQPVSEEPIKLVHVWKPGERVYLSPNLIGLQNIAMTFLPLSMNFINIIDAFREIVHGVRYEILLNAVDTEQNNDEIICRLVILEKPWLRTQWGDKVRELRHSNCTEEEAGGNTTPLSANDVNDKYVKSTVFNGGSRNELSAGEMKNLEDQIISSDISYKRMPSNKFITRTRTTLATTAKSIVENQEQQEVADTTTVQQDVDKNTVEGGDETTNSYSTNTEQTAIAEGEGDQSIDLDSTESPQSQITSSTTTTASAPGLSADDMKWLDEIFSVDAAKFNNKLNSVPTADLSDNSHDSLQQREQPQDEIQTMQPVSEEPIKLVHVWKPGERVYLSPNLIGLQNIAMTFLPLSMNFINIIDAFREIVHGVRYEILLNAVDTEQNNDEIICRLVILEKPWLRTQWGDKVRELRHSNCTEEEAGGNTTPLSANDVNDKYVKSTVFNGGSRNELSAGEMKNLEDQIISSDISYKRMPSNKFITRTRTTLATTAKSIVENQEQQEVADTTTVQQDVDKNTVEGGDETTNSYSTNTEQTAIAEGEGDQSIDLDSTESPQSQITSSTTTTASAPGLSADDMKWLDEIFSVDAAKFNNKLNSVPTADLSDNSHDSLQQREQLEDETSQVLDENNNKKNYENLGGKQFINTSLPELREYAEKFLSYSVNFDKQSLSINEAYREITNKARIKISVNAVNKDNDTAVKCLMTLVETYDPVTMKPFTLENTRCESLESA